MSPRSVVEAASVRYLVTRDLVTVYDGLLFGRALDRVSGRAPAGALTVTARRHGSTAAIAGLSAHVLDGGFYGFAGCVKDVFPQTPPAAYQVDVTIAAPGYRQASTTVTVPANPSFPISIPDLALTPDPVRLQGAVGRASDGTALLGALVTLVDDPIGPLPPQGHVLALRRPLANAHAGPLPVAGARVQPLAITGGVRHVTAAAAAGATAVVLDDRTGLNAGDAVYVGDPARGDGPFMALVAPSPAVVATPGAVQLAQPLASALAAGTEARGFTGAGGATPLGAAAQPGDGLVFTQAVVASEAVAILDVAGPGDEYRLVGAVTADSRGFYHLDGIGGVSAVFVTAAGAGLSAGPVARDIQYGQRINVVDLAAS